MKRWLVCLLLLCMAGYGFAATITVPNVAALADARVGDGDLVQTAGQVTADDGGGMLYRYDAGSAAVADGVLIVTGPGGVGRYLSQAAERAPLIAHTIPDDANLLFDVTRTDATVMARTLSLEELKKTGVQVVNVKQHGAVGDGVTDDTTAISDAFTAATSGVVYVPSGTYVLTSWTAFDIASRSLTVVCDKDAVIQGPGTGSIDFLTCGTSASLNWTGGRVTNFRYAFVCANSTTGSNVFRLRDAEIDTCKRGVIDAGTNSGEYSSFVVTDCYVHGCTEFGIANRVASIENCLVARNRIKTIGGTSANAYGIQIGTNAVNSTTHCVIADNYIEDVSMSGGSESHGILCYANYARITGNTIIDVDGGAVTTGVEGLYAKSTWAVITNNVLINAGEGGEGTICVKGQPRTGGDGTGEGYQNIIASNHVIANRSSSTDNTGIYIAITDAVCRNNTIECLGSGVMYRGIAIANDGANVTSNIVRGLYDSDDGVVGIALTNFDNCIIADNIIDDIATGLAGSSAAGITVTSSSGTMTNVNLLRNSIRTLSGGAANIGINIVHSAAITNLAINDNYLEDCSKGIDFGVTASATVTAAEIKRNRLYNFNRASMIVVGLWIEACHQCVVADNTFDVFNADDSALDCRAIYLQNTSVNGCRDVAILRNRISTLTHSTNAARERTIYINSTAAFDGLILADNEMIDVGYAMYSANVSNVTSFQLLRNRAWSYDTTYTLGTLPSDAVVDGNMAGGSLAYQTTWTRFMSGSGSPESAVTAGIGTLYLRTDGGASTTLYIKESGTGNTGWVAK